MKQTLIKITDDHYVVVDDSEIKKGDWFICSNEIHKCTNTYSLKVTSYVECKKGPCSVEVCRKITHSTQPLDIKITDEGIHLPDWSKVKALSPRVVKELIGEVDVEKKADEFCDRYFTEKGKLISVAYKSGYNQALEDNKDKIDKILDYLISKMESISQDMIDKDSLQLGRFRTYKQIYEMIKPKTEWEVTFDEQGKLRLV